MRFVTIGFCALFLLSGCETDIVKDTTAASDISVSSETIMLPTGENGFYVSCKPSVRETEVSCYNEAQAVCPKGYDIEQYRYDSWIISCR